jgi:hypothetical protein
MGCHTSKEIQMIEIIAFIGIAIVYIFGLASALYAVGTLIWFTSGDIFDKKMKIIKARNKNKPSD